MSKTKILEWFNTNNNALDTNHIILYMLAALFISIIIYITYRITYTGVSYNNKFAITNLIILLIATVLMMMISSNIAISLGMVGALSIVRYRTAIKDPNDTLFLFWSIVEGLCVGAQMLKMAAISTLFIAIVVIIANYIGFFRKKYLIIVRGDQVSAQKEIEVLIKQLYPNKQNQIRTSTVQENNFEMVIEICAKTPINNNTIDKIRHIAGVRSINWLLQTGDSIG